MTLGWWGTTSLNCSLVSSSPRPFCWCVSYTCITSTSVFFSSLISKLSSAKRRAPYTGTVNIFISLFFMRTLTYCMSVWFKIYLKQCWRCFSDVKAYLRHWISNGFTLRRINKQFTHKYSFCHDLLIDNYGYDNNWFSGELFFVIFVLEWNVKQVALIFILFISFLLTNHVLASFSCHLSCNSYTKVSGRIYLIVDRWVSAFFLWHPWKPQRMFTSSLISNPSLLFVRNYFLFSHFP